MDSSGDTSRRPEHRGRTKGLSHSDKELPAPPQSPSAYHNGSRENTNWPPRAFRPLSYSLPVLSLWVCVSLLLIVGLQLLSWKSKKDGGILFGTTVKDFTIAQRFVYVYLPVLIFVAYGLCWTWIDQNAKRLEPFYSLAESKHTPAHLSVNLDYTSTYIFLVPFKAVKLRHWSVFCTGLAMLIITVGITPFVGSIFNAETARVSSALETANQGRLMAVEDQAYLMNGGVFNAAYEHIWDNAPHAPFVNDELVLMPFGLAHPKAASSDNDTLRGETEAYRANLQCSAAISGQSAKVEAGPACKNSEVLTNGAGCFIRSPFRAQDLVKPWTVGIYSWYTTPFHTPSLDTLGCPCSAEFSNTFVSSLLSKSLSNSSIIFCRTQYERLNVNATIRLSDNSILNWSAGSPPSPLTSDQFNASSFERLLGIGPWASLFPAEDVGLSSTNHDIGDAFLLGNSANNLGKLRPNTEVSTEDLGQYVFAYDKRPIEDFMDPDARASALQKTYRLLFNLAFKRLILKHTENVSQEGTAGELVQSQGVVTVSPTFVILAQSCLGVSTVLAVACYCINRTRCTRLEVDPSSLAQMISLVGKSFWRLPIADRAPFREPLGAALDDRCFRLMNSTERSPTPRIEMFDEAKRTGLSINHDSDKRTLWKPLEIRTLVLLLFIGGLVIVIAALGSINRIIRSSGGLKLTFQSAFVRNLALNYIPTLLGTLLEALWIVINRSFCVLTPFEELKKGTATGKASLGAHYTGLPPQLVVFKALRARHLLLVTICLVAIVANVLSIALSGLFVIEPTTVRTPQLYTVRPLVGQETTIPNKLDYVYPMEGNFTDNTPLPPWVSPSHFFLPVQWSSHPMPSSNASVPKHLRAKTSAIGINPRCTKSQGVAVTNSLGRHGMVSLTNGGGQGKAYCNSFYGAPQALYSGANYEYGKKSLRNAALASGVGQESFARLAPGTVGSSFQPIDPCRNTYVISWLRAGPHSYSDSVPLNVSNLAPAHVAGSFVTCNPEVQVMNVEVLVNKQGYILEVNDTSAVQQDPAPFFEPFIDDAGNRSYTSQIDLIEELFNLFSPTDGTPAFYWHEATFAADWLNYLIKLKTGSSAHVDPHLPPSDADELAPIVSDILARAFAISQAKVRSWIPPRILERNTTGTGFIESTEERIFFAPYMFELTVSLLSLNLLVALLVLLRRPSRFLPLIPTTIAAIAFYVAGSSLHEDVLSGRLTANELAKCDDVIGFGHYLGVDGTPRVGIEREVFIRRQGFEGAVGKTRRWWRKFIER